MTRWLSLERSDDLSSRDPTLGKEGDGYLISFPDFFECVSGGGMPEDTTRNGTDALVKTIASQEDGDKTLNRVALKHAIKEKDIGQDDDDLRFSPEGWARFFRH